MSVAVTRASRRGVLLLKMIKLNISQLKENYMELGNFSLSLKVKDMESSLSFYEKLGFKVIDGGISTKVLQIPTP